MAFLITGILPSAPTQAGATLAYVTNSDSGSVTTSTVTFTGVSIGTATADRLVIVVANAVGVPASGAYSSILIGNVTATIATQKCQPPLSGIAYLNVASGTTADIKVTANQTASDIEIGVYWLSGYVSSTPENSTASGAVSGSAVNLSFTPSATAVLVYSTVEQGTIAMSVSWNVAGTVTQDAQANFSGTTTRRYSHGNITGLTNTSGTLTSAAASAQVLAYAEWH